MCATDLRELRQRVESAIEHYHYPTSANTVGAPWTRPRIEAKLAVTRTAVLDPYWVDVEFRDTHEQIDAESKEVRMCAVVADDGNGTVLAFDPTDNEFLLAIRCEDDLVTIGVRGDAVGCFMSR
jgi:hypothetical protein